MEERNKMYYPLNCIFIGDTNATQSTRFTYMLNAFRYYNDGDASGELVEEVNKLVALNASLSVVEKMAEKLTNNDALHRLLNRSRYEVNLPEITVNGPLIGIPDKETVSLILDSVASLEQRLSEIDTVMIAQYIRKKAKENGDL